MGVSTMRKSLVFLILLFFCFLSCDGLVKREKKKKIGFTDWYTEQSDFETLKKISAKKEKPLFFVFSAVWCAPCQMVKKTVFETKDFTSVAEKVVPVYIEQTQEKGQQYVEQFKIVSFPTFMLVNSQGTILDRGSPSRTLEGFDSWIEKVISGDTITQKLQENPDDRASLMEIAKKLRPFEIEEKIRKLRRVIELNPAATDDLTQEASEMIVDAFSMKLFHDQANSETYAHEIEEEFLKYSMAYYPDKYRFALKNGKAFLRLMTFFNILKNWERSYEVFHDFKGLELPLKDKVNIYGLAIWTALQKDDVTTAQEIMKETKSFTELDRGLLESEGYWAPYLMNYRGFIGYFHQKDSQEAERYAALLYTDIENMKSHLKNPRMVEQFVAELLLYITNEYGYLIKETLNHIEPLLAREIDKVKEIDHARGRKGINLIIKKSRILAKYRDKDDAFNFLKETINDKKYLDRLASQDKALLLNSATETCLENEIKKPEILVWAEEAVQLQTSYFSLSTRARTYAYFEKFSEAIIDQEKALELIKETQVPEEKKAGIIKEYEQNIEKWRQQLS